MRSEPSEAPRSINNLLPESTMAGSSDVDERAAWLSIPCTSDLMARNVSIHRLAIAGQILVALTGDIDEKPRLPSAS